jgi:hypothetical protein
MSDAAQGEPRQHEVFSTPFKVEPKYESWETPDNYRSSPGGEQLGDTIKVWRVQNSGKSYGSVVSTVFGFEDSPDAEILTPGYNRGKEYGAVGVGRHGNFLGWGFSMPPSRMTEAGKNFFLNCICYIRKFDGKPPLIKPTNDARLWALNMAMRMPTRRNKELMMRRFFSPEILAECKNDPALLAGYCREHIELMYRDKRVGKNAAGEDVWPFRVDQDLVSLGLTSNRKIETLEKLIGMLADAQKAPAAEALLKRYTDQKFETSQQWRDWLEKSRGRIYFTDVGGYKFLVVPEGYLSAATTAPAAKATGQE